ncbi:unnamed protein product [Schistosoma mattheei]|uniref:Uncharacterized protein n=1 Tax=Schistosoma mattheei TaxID=31246 RepID=A0A183NYI7_9TREM|nr:unnamed protein product [Schistosoma mattheei]
MPNNKINFTGSATTTTTTTTTGTTRTVTTTEPITTTTSKPTTTHGVITTTNGETTETSLIVTTNGSLSSNITNSSTTLLNSINTSSLHFDNSSLNVREESNLSNGTINTTEFMQSTALPTTTNNDINGTTIGYSRTTLSPPIEKHANNLTNTTNPSTNSSRRHSIKGRVILATTREQGSRVWGLTAAKAELACHRFITNRRITSALTNQTNNGNVKPTDLYQGHLLSVTSNDEVSVDYFFKYMSYERMIAYNP